MDVIFPELERVLSSNDTVVTRSNVQMRREFHYSLEDYRNHDFVQSIIPLSPALPSPALLGETGSRLRSIGDDKPCLRLSYQRSQIQSSRYLG